MTDIHSTIEAAWKIESTRLIEQELLTKRLQQTEKAESA
jgi:hypothetical protein